MEAKVYDLAGRLEKEVLREQKINLSLKGQPL